LSAAIITPSFRLDLDRCRLLSESVQRWVPAAVHHYIVVDRRDRDLFASLKSSRTSLVCVEDVIPWWILRIPKVRRFWLSLKTLPIRNWMLQQIVKLSASRIASEDELVFVDSDVFFVRPFDPREAVRDARIPLFREYGPQLQLASNQRWHETAARLIGLEPQQSYLTSYVGNMITWSGRNLRRLHDRIEQTTGRSWIEALSRLPVLSEYVLYGMFCECVLGDASGHYFESTINSLCYWNNQPLGTQELQELKSKLAPEHVAVMISAKAKVPMESIRSVFMV
jgi:hypothetical protein